MLDFKRPLTTVDVVIFAIKNDALQVLLVQRGTEASEPFPSMWALPGGFINVDRDIDLEACAIRKLQDKTGVSSPYLEQLGSWGSADRDPRGWSTTNAYFALIPASAPLIEKGANAADARWFPIAGDGLAMRLAFDHKTIVDAAVSRLRNKVEYTSLPVYLMPAEFTLPDLQRVYEVVLGRPLEKSAFRARIIGGNLIAPVSKMRTGPNRPAQLYRLRRAKSLLYFARTFNQPK